jgi:hypothetical protein
LVLALGLFDSLLNEVAGGEESSAGQRVGDLHDTKAAFSMFKGYLRETQILCRATRLQTILSLSRGVAQQGFHCSCEYPFRIFERK